MNLNNNKTFSKWNEKYELKNYKTLLLFLILILMVTGNVPVVKEVVRIMSVPLFIYLFINSFGIKLKKKLSKYSKHTTNIWLFHSFFIYLFFQDILFSLKYSLLIIVFLFSVCLLCSKLVNKIIFLSKKIEIKRGAAV